MSNIVASERVFILSRLCFFTPLGRPCYGACVPVSIFLTHLLLLIELNDINKELES